MKVLMIYPEYPNTFWSFKGALEFVGKKAAYPPLGLLTVASMLPTWWEIKLIDLNTTKLTDKQIIWADLVFISAMLIQLDSAMEITKKCKTHNKTVVAGGPAFTTTYENFENVDHFVLGEAENTLAQFIDDLENNQAKKVYLAKIESDNNRPDIKKTPKPMWSLINLENYACMSIQYSRGCPMNCEFCDIVFQFGRIPRTKSPDQMVKELQSLYDYNWTGSVFIVDDNFIGNKKLLVKVLEKIIKWQEKNNFPFNFFTEVDISLAQDENLMNLMSKAGFNKVFIGIETPNKDSLKECNKHHNLKNDLIDSVRKILANGMQVMAGFIVGFDNDDESIFKKMSKFIHESGVVISMVGILSALPGTRLWERLKKEKRLIDTASGNNTDAEVNFLPKKMSINTLKSGYIKLLKEIYNSKIFYKRIKKQLTWFEPKNQESKLDFNHFCAFLKSVFLFGVKDKKNRKEYWDTLFWTLINRPKCLSHFVVLSIFGYHFSQTVAEIEK